MLLNKTVYSILELDRVDNSRILRSSISLTELPTIVCDARLGFDDYKIKYLEYNHIFNSLTNSGFIGLWISLLNTFKIFIETEYENILILEDDVKLVPNFNDFIKKIFDELPDDFGLLSIGYRKLYESYFNEEHEIGKSIICKIFQTGDSWAVLYNRKFIIELLQVLRIPKMLHGISDTAIYSFALGNIEKKPSYKSYSIKPSIGSLVIHDNNQQVSSISNSKNI